MTHADLVTAWRNRARELEPYAAAAATAFARAAEELEAALAEETNPLLSLAEASERSNYHRESLARLVRSGKLRNYGTPRRPLVRAKDLPKKAERAPLTLRRSSGNVGAR